LQRPIQALAAVAAICEKRLFCWHETAHMEAAFYLTGPYSLSPRL